MALHDDHWSDCEDPENCNCGDLSPCPTCNGDGFVIVMIIGGYEMTEDCPNPHCDEGLVHKDFFKQKEAQAS